MVPPQPTGPARVRAYLDVPYSEKDEAKHVGARWDPGVRRWYDLRPPKPALQRWAARPEVPELLPGEDRSFGQGLFVDLVPSSCWFTNVRWCVTEADWERLRRPPNRLGWQFTPGGVGDVLGAGGTAAAAAVERQQAGARGDRLEVSHAPAGAAQPPGRFRSSDRLPSDGTVARSRTELRFGRPPGHIARPVTPAPASLLGS